MFENWLDILAECDYDTKCGADATSHDGTVAFAQCEGKGDCVKCGGIKNFILAWTFAIFAISFII